MEPDAFDEDAFFSALGSVRALLIGRRALVALGLPLMTVDYDVWLHADDIDALNHALAPLDLTPSRTAAEARAHGRYVLENGERVDVLVAKSASTPDGLRLSFDEAWERHVEVEYGASKLRMPSIDDLVVTKLWASRDKDIADIRLLRALQERKRDVP